MAATYTVDELFGKLERADAAGDTEAAKVIADEIRRIQGQPQAAPAAAPVDYAAQAARETYDASPWYQKPFIAAGAEMTRLGRGIGQLVTPSDSSWGRSTASVIPGYRNTTDTASSMASAAASVPPVAGRASRRSRKTMCRSMSAKGG